MHGDERAGWMSKRNVEAEASLAELVLAPAPEPTGSRYGTEKGAVLGLCRGWSWLSLSADNPSSTMHGTLSIAHGTRQRTANFPDVCVAAVDTTE